MRQGYKVKKMKKKNMKTPKRKISCHKVVLLLGNSRIIEPFLPLFYRLRLGAST
jgi:hypothetical protein